MKSCNIILKSNRDRTSSMENGTKIWQHPLKKKRNEKKLSTVPLKTWTPSEDMCHNNNQATCAELNTDKDKRLKSACPSKTIQQIPSSSPLVGKKALPFSTGAAGH